MLRVAKYLLYLLLALGIALWLALGLFRPEQLKGPLSAWVEHQTGLPLRIGKLEYNPLYPNIVLAEQVSLGPDLQADKLYLEIASGSWWRRELHIAHLDIIGPRINWHPGLTLPSLPLRNLHLADLNIERLSLSWPGGKLTGGTLALGDWQPIQDDRLQPLTDVGFSASAGVLELGGLRLDKVSLAGALQHGRLSLQRGAARTLDGHLNTRLEWDPARRRLEISELALDGLRLDLDRHALPALPLQELHIAQAQLKDLSLSSGNRHLALNKLNGQLSALTWRPGAWPSLEFQGHADEWVNGALQLTALQGEGRLREQEWRARLKGEAYLGQVELDAEGDPRARSLTLNRLRLAHLQPELQPGWRDWWRGLPLSQLTVRQLDIQDLALLSFDPQLPLSLKGTSLFLTDLILTPDSLSAAGDKARLEAGWAELVYDGVVGYRGELRAELEGETLRLRSLSTQSQQGRLQAQGALQLAGEQPHQLQLQLEDLDLERLSHLLKPQYAFDGRGDLKLELSARGRNWSTLGASLSGELTLAARDLFLDGLRLDPYLDRQLASPALPARQSLAQSLTAMAGGDSAFNRAHLRLAARQGQVRLDGSAAASITHLLALQGGLDLVRQQWALRIGVLNDRRCAELQARLQGALDDPQLLFLPPAGNCPPWSTAPVEYPPQGKRGPLRQ